MLILVLGISTMWKWAVLTSTLKMKVCVPLKQWFPNLAVCPSPRSEMEVGSTDRVRLFTAEVTLE
jgi:hypothetical protein